MNKLRVQVSINVVRWLAFEAWAISYHNESINSSLNRNNFLELIQLLSCYNEKGVDIVIKKASTNALYTSSHISKRRLFMSFLVRLRQCYMRKLKMQSFVLVSIKFVMIPKKEQMILILRFVKDNFIHERFFNLVQVRDTTTLTFKDEIFSSPFHHDLIIQNI